MAQAFEQISLFDSPACEAKSQNDPLPLPSPAAQPQLPVTDPRSALDASHVMSQAMLLLRGLSYNTLKHSHLSHKYKLVQILACEAKLKAGLSSPIHSVRNAYMAFLKESSLP